MTYDFNVTGAERKKLVEIISETMNMHPVYKGAPTFAYVVNNLTISRNGEVSVDARTSQDMMNRVLENLAAAGFSLKSVEGLETEDETPENEEPTTAEDEGYGLTIQVPREGFTDGALNNLRALIAAKGWLICKALGVSSLPVEVADDKVSFPWFDRELTADESSAYIQFISNLCNMAKTQKRITAKDRQGDVSNEKYTFRCFLLRLGFIGAEYKDARKILLKNLTGSSAFKSEERKTEPVSDQIPTIDWDAENLDDAIFIAKFNAWYDANHPAEAKVEGGAD